MRLPLTIFGFVLLVVASITVVTARGSSKPYTQKDLRDVRNDYALLRPIYLGFRAAYFRNDARSMARYYDREQVVCSQVDQIDRRDSIDPNVNLFQASVGLDNFCNDIESGYAAWQRSHHLRYDKRVVPAFPGDVFKGGDLSLKKIAGFLRHPSALS